MCKLLIWLFCKHIIIIMTINTRVDLYIRSQKREASNLRAAWIALLLVHLDSQSQIEESLRSEQQSRLVIESIIHKV